MFQQIILRSKFNKDIIESIKNYSNIFIVKNNVWFKVIDIKNFSNYFLEVFSVLKSL